MSFKSPFWNGWLLRLLIPKPVPFTAVQGCLLISGGYQGLRPNCQCFRPLQSLLGYRGDGGELLAREVPPITWKLFSFCSESPWPVSPGPAPPGQACGYEEPWLVSDLVSLQQDLSRRSKWECHTIWPFSPVSLVSVGCGQGPWGPEAWQLTRERERAQVYRVHSQKRHGAEMHKKYY